MNKIFIRSEIKSNQFGYAYLTSLIREVEVSPDKDVFLDFSATRWIDANLVSILGAIVYYLTNKGYYFNDYKSTFNSRIQDVLIRNQFLERKDYRSTKTTSTIVPYMEFNKSDINSFDVYLVEQILKKQDFPKHTEKVRKAISESIGELFQNARDASAIEYIYTCGQYFPRKDSASKLDFTIVDIGIPFSKNVNNYLDKMDSTHTILSSVESIDWAIKKGNTTKSETGGLGLDLILTFLELNKGKMQIVSDNGYWLFDSGSITSRQFMAESFPGAIINIEFNFDDNASYSMKSESQNN